MGLFFFAPYFVISSIVLNIVMYLKRSTEPELQSQQRFSFQVLRSGFKQEAEFLLEIILFRIVKMRFPNVF
ncbi:hypothetical protein Y032_0026g1488 [Ancylostoma ceylanicum]|uniref:Uncharacterized protein n=1 Tax=Ancylostoma ceylanicum TaxID=53326 RepID=A0A016UW28_9BILA|nr:hypothetical protein Y032_0026g1488 [Ancylostoma ceylanicum]